MDRRLTSLRILAPLFFLAWVTYGNFTNALINPNTLSRLALTASLVEFGQVSIDRFKNTLGLLRSRPGGARLFVHQPDRPVLRAGRR